MFDHYSRDRSALSLGFPFRPAEPGGTENPMKRGGERTVVAKQRSADAGSAGAASSL